MVLTMVLHSVDVTAEQMVEKWEQLSVVLLESTMAVWTVGYLVGWLVSGLAGWTV